jgi:hypothetical protein
MPTLLIAPIILLTPLALFGLLLGLGHFVEWCCTHKSAAPSGSQEKSNVA